MLPLSRREFLSASTAAGAGIAFGANPSLPPPDLHRQILELAALQEQQRTARFAAVNSIAELKELQIDLRHRFLNLIDGWPGKDKIPSSRKTGEIAGGDYTVEKLAFESMPGYWVPSLLYRPAGPLLQRPAIISPCGHSRVGKAAETYQILHINLVKRGFVVLTYDPVGQGERSQFWDSARGESRFNRVCGEHCVLGNPLYLLGTSLAKYRIWDGMRAIDYLTSLEDVDPGRIGCVGNSGGGTLTAYIAALDERVRVPIISCYITALPHRMRTRIEADPDSDPEQDIFGFVEQGIDHAGLLAMMTPRPTLICAAQRDFFPIEGTRQTFAEVQHLYEVAGTAEQLRLVEANARHGLSLTLREAAYGWFQRWLDDHEVGDPDEEIPVTPRAPEQLLVCTEGQANITLRSRPLLSLALSDFRRRREENRFPRSDLKTLLKLDAEFDTGSGSFRLTEVAPLKQRSQDLFVLVNGTNSTDWRLRDGFLASLAIRGAAVTIVDPRGIGELRGKQTVAGQAYGDPLSGVEENLAYNAFLTGRSLLGMRVADVLRALEKITDQRRPKRVVLCGCLDAGLLAAFAAAVEPRIDVTAIEETRLSFLPLFEPHGLAINAAELVPGLLRDFGDVAEVLAAAAPRKVLAAACTGSMSRDVANVRISAESFSTNPEELHTWLADV